MNKKLLAILLLGAAVIPAFPAVEEEDNHECTSWVVMPDLTGGKTMLLHKNRDSMRLPRTNLFRVAQPGKHAWIGISSGPQTAPSSNAGVNDCGVSIVMNNGDRTDVSSPLKGCSTPGMAMLALENCSTAAEAVEYIRGMVKAKKYSHGKNGSIWIVCDPNKAFIIENDAARFAAHEVKSGFGVRANGWHFPEMVIYSTLPQDRLTRYARREFSVRSTLFAEGSKYKEPVTIERMNAPSRVDAIPGEPKCPPVCGSKTVSGATIAIDREFPGVLTTLYAAFGHPRFTVYLPIPFTIDQVPPELQDNSFSEAIFARYDAKRELLPQDKIVEFERELNKRQEEAIEKARAILKKGGTKEEAAKILNEVFRQNWEAVKKLSAGK